MVEISEQTARVALALLEIANAQTGADKMKLAVAQLELEQVLRAVPRDGE